MVSCKTRERVVVGSKVPWVDKKGPLSLDTCLERDKSTPTSWSPSRSLLRAGPVVPSTTCLPRNCPAKNEKHDRSPETPLLVPSPRTRSAERATVWTFNILLHVCVYVHMCVSFKDRERVRRGPVLMQIYAGRSLCISPGRDGAKRRRQATRILGYRIHECPRSSVPCSAFNTVKSCTRALESGTPPYVYTRAFRVCAAWHCWNSNRRGRGTNRSFSSSRTRFSRVRYWRVLRNIGGISGRGGLVEKCRRSREGTGRRCSRNAHRVLDSAPRRVAARGRSLRSVEG